MFGFILVCVNIIFFAALVCENWFLLIFMDSSPTPPNKLESRSAPLYFHVNLRVTKVSMESHVFSTSKFSIVNVN